MSKRSRRAKGQKRAGDGAKAEAGRRSLAPVQTEPVKSERPSAPALASEPEPAPTSAPEPAPAPDSTPAPAAAPAVSPAAAPAPPPEPARPRDSVPSPSPASSDAHHPHKLEEAFFARADDASESLPPASVDEAHDEDRPAPLSPEILARRARLRKIVAGIVGAAGVAAILVGAQHLLSSSHPAHPASMSITAAGQQAVVPSIENVPAAARVAPPAPKAAPPVPVESAAAPVASAEAKPVAAPAEATPAEPAASAQPAPPASASAATTADAGDPKAMKKHARSLIERGRMKEGIAAAQAAIDADPSDAELYLLLGAAQQDTGHWKDSIATFSRCVHEATHGPKGECRALGGH